ncbi:Synaptotagmin-4 [Hibiscus syriacus]|uniref:Synaptotagmin-4 n=1 Tax=Hibiscus syriacus TaxID=106335 RepID=A0A6A3CBE8_HIBSY|nr:Synaptotagmin-4 [Hibiscus syriacus]
MGFLFGMFVGFSIGIWLIISFAKYAKIPSTRRAFLARTVAAFARMTVQDSRKNLPRQFYPPWSLLILVSSLIQLVWLNVQLEKIWPSVDEAASELIRASVEPVLEQYTPAILSSMKFDKLTLGTVAPQFTGISIIESESGADGITMEMVTQISSLISTPNSVLPCPDRLIFKLLVDQFPCFGAVAYSLKEKRALNFTLKVVGGDLSSIPGVSDAIEETIRNAIEDSITWPVRNIVQIIPGDYKVSIFLELKPVGKLDVKLVQAKELTNKDIIGKSDPFDVLFIRPLLDKTKTSKTIFIVEDVSTQHSTVKVFDDEGVQDSELLGCAQFVLDLEPGKVKEVWLKLVKDLVVQRDNKYRGQVQLELLYNPYGTDSRLKNPFNHDYSLTSLEKSLKPSNIELEGENLPPVDLNGKEDPFVVLTMKKSEAKSKTRVANETLNPVWNQTFDFVVEGALHEMLILDILDHDTFRKEKIGRIAMTMTNWKGNFKRVSQ